MATDDTGKPLSRRAFQVRIRQLKDLAITLLLWSYFTLGFVILFAPFYLMAFFFAKDRPAAFQRLNCRFYRGFFSLCRAVIPRIKWDISPEVRTIRSAVIVCNHVSYLDSILMVSLFPRLTTIAKARLFDIPIFGRMLAFSGYIPSSGEGSYATLLLNSMDTLTSHLESGGNVLVFPEGTRSRDGRVGPLNKGAFKIARKFDIPLEVLKIENTNQLFTPGKFLFNTGCHYPIRVQRVAGLHPDYRHSDFSMKELIVEVQRLIAEAGTEPSRTDEGIRFFAG